MKEWKKRKATALMKGQYTLNTKLHEFRMSRWVNGFGLVEECTGEYILPFIAHFDLLNFQEFSNHLNIEFPIYPSGNVNYRIMLFPQFRYFVFNNITYPIDNYYEIFTGKQK